MEIKHSHISTYNGTHIIVDFSQLRLEVLNKNDYSYDFKADINKDSLPWFVSESQNQLFIDSKSFSTREEAEIFAKKCFEEQREKMIKEFLELKI